jgi:uncharacterized membrane protein YhaH (DUF805 family)
MSALNRAGGRMGIGGSLVLIAIGAILKFAVTAKVSGIDLSTVGVVLMIIGIVGLLISIAFLTARRRTDVRYRRDGATYVEPPPTSIDPRF